MSHFHPPCSWQDAVPTLLTAAALDLDAGGVPLPMLVAFDGDEPLAVITLRPFDPGEVLQAHIEVLSLLLPMGADRLACSLPARVGPNDQSTGGTTRTVPVDPADLHPRARRLLVITADGHDGPARTEVMLLPGEPTPEGWRWHEPLHDTPCEQTPLVAALAVLLDAREELVAGSSSLHLAAQLGRVLLRGHELAVAPRLAQRLEFAASD